MQRTGANTWDLLECVERHPGVHEYVLIARIVATSDAWFVERPVYQDVGHYFERIPRPFVTSKAAVRYATQPVRS